MSPHEITQLLEPSNLLEPLDLTEQRTGFTERSPRVETGAGAQRRRSREMDGMRRPSGSERRSGFRPILMVAGALACFGAGTLLPQLQSLTREDLGLGLAGANPSVPPAPLADAAAKSEAASSPEPRSANLSAKPDAPLKATAAAPPRPHPAEANTSAVIQGFAPVSIPQPAANDVSVGCAGSCNHQACPGDDANCLEGGAPTRVKALTKADGSAADPAQAQPARAVAKSQPDESEGADTRTTSHQEERTQSQRPSKRAAQHERADKHGVAKRGAVTVSRSSRGNANQPSFWRRDLASGDSMPTANSSGWWQRERYDDYPRDRSRVRAGRDDDFLMGARYRW
jgi:hypothetical protein